MFKSPRGACIGAVVAMAVGFGVARSAMAQFDRPTVNDPNLVVQVFSYTPAQGMDWGPGGAWGDFMYVSSSFNEIKRIDAAGNATTFATGLTFPTGVAFSPDASGPFGDYLYVLEDNGAIKRVDSAGNVTPFATAPADGSTDLNDLAFGNGLGGFSTNLYVTDGSHSGGFPGQVFEVNSAGNVSTFFGTDPFSAGGIAFTNSPVTPMLVTDALNFTFDDAGIRAFASNGTFFTVIPTASTDLVDPNEVITGSASEDTLYITDFTTDKLYRFVPGVDGGADQLIELATGFSFQSWYDGDLLLSTDGEALYISDLGAEHCEGFGLIYRIGAPGTFVEPECGDDGDPGVVPTPAALPAGLILLGAIAARRRRHG